MPLVVMQANLQLSPRIKYIWTLHIFFQIYTGLQTMQNYKHVDYWRGCNTITHLSPKSKGILKGIHKTFNLRSTTKYLCCRGEGWGIIEIHWSKHVSSYKEAVGPLNKQTFTFYVLEMFTYSSLSNLLTQALTESRSMLSIVSELSQCFKKADIAAGSSSFHWTLLLK